MISWGAQKDCTPTPNLIRNILRPKFLGWNHRAAWRYEEP
jgi:hypothetical protein